MKPPKLFESEPLEGEKQGETKTNMKKEIRICSSDTGLGRRLCMKEKKKSVGAMIS